MIVARIASWIALAITVFNAVRGLALWRSLSASQRWFAVYLFGSSVIGLTMLATALLGLKNWGLANAWSAWIAVTIGPALAEGLGKVERRLALGLILLWLGLWTATRLNFGLQGWDGLAHPALCGLLLGIGMFAFDRVIKEDSPFWKNRRAVMVVAVGLLASSDALAWAGMKHFTDHDSLLQIWTARNIAMVPVAILTSWVF